MTTLPSTSNSSPSTSITLPRPMGPGGTLAPPGVGGGGAGGLMHGGGFVAPGTGLTGADAMRVVRQNIWLIVISLVVSIVLGFGLNYLLEKYYARYTATGYVQIQSGTPVVNPFETVKAPTLGEYNTLVVEQRSQATMLKTDALFTQVLMNVNAGIRDTAWFQHFRKSDGSFDIAAAKKDLYDNFSANPIGDSKLIGVTFTNREPKDCRTVVMDIVNQHIENERKRNADKSINNTQLLNNLRIRYETHVKELKQSTSMMAAKLQLDGYGRPGGVGQKESELSQYVTEKLKAESEAAQAQSAFDSAKKQIEQGGTPAAVEAMVNQSPMVMRWKQNVDELDVSLRAVPNGTASPTYKRIMDQREASQDKLDEVKAEERANDTVMYMDRLASDAEASNANVKKINDQIDKTKNDLADMTTTLSDYLTKKDEETGYQELLKRVRDQLDAFTTIFTANDMNTVSWGPQPETPDTPSFPNLPVTMVVCIGAGLALSLGISFARELMDTTVRSPRDIARVGQMTLLGMIPHEDDDPQASGVPVSSVIYAAPTSMMAEQFRQVRTRLQHAASLDTTRSILVTSPGPGDGKTVVAANLAAGLALNGRRILLVDANFRRPELHKLFDVPNDVGLGNVLSSIENFEGAIRQTKVPNLDLMTAGPKPGNATELLESQLLIDFIERALEEYDHVIFDSGPMLVVSETVALAPRVDGVVTVVRARSNSRGLLARLKDTLRQLKAEHLGVVLNAVRSQAGGYYDRNIRTYYEYQNGHAA